MSEVQIQERKFLCIACRMRTIKEQRTEFPCPLDEIPDQSNCDFSKYSEPTTSGGKLIKTRPQIPWKTKGIDQEASFSDFGGVCNQCLLLTDVRALLRCFNIELDS